MMQSAKTELSARRTPPLKPFLTGTAAGVVALLFNLFLRVGSIAPYPPESAIESFLKLVPASIEEPAVQRLGDLAGQLGLVAASIVAVVIYGILGVIFEREVSQRLSSLTRFEKALSYSLVPWILFGAVLMPIFGVSLFGTLSVFADSNSPWLFPLSLLFVQLVYTSAFYYISGKKGEERRRISKSEIRTTHSSISSARGLSRRSFVERGVLGAGILALSLSSIDRILATLSPSPISGPPNSPIALKDAPAIFEDPRLAPLVDDEVTPNNSFYRVAIDLFDPSVDASTWTLSVSGLVGSQKSYTLSSLRERFQPVDQYNTFECVSNLVNGNLIGNAKWSGVRISDLLKDAGGSPLNAQYMVFYSVDGYSVGIPLSRALMPDSMLAYSMNDQPLPQKHGYPLRAVIPGLYGMMSAKWINKIELVSSPYDGFWQTRGWSPTGVVQTLAFIMIPTSNVSLSRYNGSVILGGVAYAGDRGISKVEVSVDGGKTWQEAQLKPALSNTTWRLWAYDWHPSSTGNYNVYARATDGAGATQTANQTDTFPNGATGYAMTTINVGA